MDHLYAPDEQGHFDDWSDFSVNLMEEELKTHHSSLLNKIINPNERNSTESDITASINNNVSSPRLNQTPSSTWRNDLTSFQMATSTNNHNNNTMPEATGDQYLPHNTTSNNFINNNSSWFNRTIDTNNQNTILQSLHPQAAGLSVPDNTTRSLTGTTDRRVLSDKTSEAIVNVEDVEKNVEDFGDKIKQKFYSVENKVKNELKEGETTIENEAGNLKDKLSSLFRSNKNTVNNDQNTIMQSLHPQSAGLSVPDNTTRSLTGTTDSRFLSTKTIEKTIPINDNSNDFKHNIKNKVENVENKMKSTLHSAEDKVKVNSNKIKNELKNDKNKLKNESEELGNKIALKAENVKNSIENKMDKMENNIKNVKNDIKSDAKKLENKVEKNVELLKNKSENELHNVKNNIEYLGEKSKEKIIDLKDNINEGINSIKNNLSTQNDEPNIKVINNATVIIEDWDKHTENEPGLFTRLSQRLSNVFGYGNTDNNTNVTTTDSTINNTSNIRDYHRGPSPSINKGNSPKETASLDYPSKEFDTNPNSLDMIGKKRVEIDSFTTVNDKGVGNPWPASHIPSKMRVDQSTIEDIKKYSHQGYGQADKDYYGGNENMFGTGNPNTSK